MLRPDVALGHEAAFDELADALGDDGPSEAGPGDQLGPRARPPEADLVEDDDEGIERLVRQRAEPARWIGGAIVAVTDHGPMIPRRASKSPDFCT